MLSSIVNDLAALFDSTGTTILRCAYTICLFGKIKTSCTIPSGSPFSANCIQYLTLFPLFAAFASQWIRTPDSLKLHEHRDYINSPCRVVICQRECSWCSIEPQLTGFIIKRKLDALSFLSWWLDVFLGLRIFLSFLTVPFLLYLHRIFGTSDRHQTTSWTPLQGGLLSGMKFSTLFVLQITLILLESRNFSISYAEK